MIRILIVSALAAGMLGCASIRPQDIEGPVAVYVADTATWQVAGVFRPAKRRPVIVLQEVKDIAPTRCARTEYTRNLLVLSSDGSLRMEAGRLLRCDGEDAIEI